VTAAHKQQARPDRRPPLGSAYAPGLRERRLPSLDREIAYARDFGDAAHHGDGEAFKQQSNFFDGQLLTYRPT